MQSFRRWASKKTSSKTARPKLSFLQTPPPTTPPPAPTPTSDNSDTDSSAWENFMRSTSDDPSLADKPYFEPFDNKQNVIPTTTTFFSAHENFSNSKTTMSPNQHAEQLANASRVLRQGLLDYQELLHEEQFRKRFKSLFITAARINRYNQLSKRAIDAVKQRMPNEPEDSMEFHLATKYAINAEYKEMFAHIRNRVVRNELDPQRKVRYEDEVNAFLNKLQRRTASDK